MVVNMFQYYFLDLSHPLLPSAVSTSLFSMFVSLLPAVQILLRPQGPHKKVVEFLLISHRTSENLNFLNKIHDYCTHLLEPELLMLNSKENFMKQMFSTYLYSSCALNI